MRAYIPGLWKLNLKLRPYDVICQWCWQRYQKVHESPTQGDGCAATVEPKDDKWYVSCHYGSAVDGNRYIFTRPYFNIVMDPFCDQCIKVILDLKIIEQVPGNYLFGLNEDYQSEKTKTY